LVNPRLSSEVIWLLTSPQAVHLQPDTDYEARVPSLSMPH
jgi:hypothetical protein